MKFSNLKAFEKHVEGAAPAHFANVYLIISKDPYVQKRAIERLTTALLVGEKHPELCLKKFETDQLQSEVILSELHGTNFFAQKQIVLVHLPEKPLKAILTDLQGYCSKPSRSSFLIMAAASVNHSTNFYKNAEKCGIILEVGEEKPRDKEKSMLEWLANRFSAAGKACDPKVCQLLVQQVGTEQMLLDNEVNKLLCYVGDAARVTVQDVGAICISANCENVWQLGEAIFRRDATAALRISKGLLDEGTALIALLRQIRNQFQTEFQICSLLASGAQTHAITQKFPYMVGYILDRHLGMARGYGMAGFVRGMQKIDETELMAKNSGLDHNLLAELLIVKLCQK